MDNFCGVVNAGKNKIYYSVEKFLYQGDVRKRVVVDKAEVGEGVLTIPESICIYGEDIPVMVIGKKAFLGSEDLVGVILPNTITTIDNWAFAQCKNLRKVVILAKEVTYGKGVFSDSDNIDNICMENETENAKSALFAAVCNMTDWGFVYGHMDSDEWFARWDDTLVAYLKKDDLEGSLNQMLGGEEDINKSTLSYVLDKKKLKVKLCFLRLLKEDNIAYKTKRILREYIKAHSKGNELDVSWRFILDNHPDDLRYYKILNESGGITKSNKDHMLSDLGGHHLEAKNYLLNQTTKQEQSEDIFADFAL